MVPGGKRLGLPGGQATLGVRRGQLRFILQNCTMPLEKTDLLTPLKASIAVEQQKTRSSELQLGASTAFNLAPKVGRGSSEKATVEVFQIKNTGSEEHPAWVFESYDDRRILEEL